jgi:hypothetical protein
VMSGRGLCDGLITRPEESYRLWRLVVCDQETSNTRRLKARYWAVKIQPQWVVTPGKQTNKQQRTLCNLPTGSHSQYLRSYKTLTLTFACVRNEILC